MSPGTRVRFNERCVWPERVGCEGVVVNAPVPGVYPDDPRDRSRVLVLLDDDPLDATENGWTCATTKDSLDLIKPIDGGGA